MRPGIFFRQEIGDVYLTCVFFTLHQCNLMGRELFWVFQTYITLFYINAFSEWGRGDEFPGSGLPFIDMNRQ